MNEWLICLNVIKAQKQAIFPLEYLDEMRLSVEHAACRGLLRRLHLGRQRKGRTTRTKPQKRGSQNRIALWRTLRTELSGCSHINEKNRWPLPGEYLSIYCSYESRILGQLYINQHGAGNLACTIEKEGVDIAEKNLLGMDD